MAAENDLISRTALLAKMQYRLPVEDDISETVSNCARIARKLVERATAVDAVEVVRCGRCANRGDSDKCPMRHLVWKPDVGYIWADFTMDEYFCSFGERKE